MEFSKIKEKLSVKKIIAIIVASFILFELAATVAVSESFLNTQRFAESEKGQSVLEKELSSVQYIKWLEGTAQSVDDESFTGLYLKNNATSHSNIILLHSLTTTAKDMAVYAYHFHSLGFNVYIPQYIKGSCTMGFEEKEQVARVVNMITEKDEKATIFLFGVGIGATTSILATTQSLPSNVKGVIADSPYSRVDELFKENIKELYGFSAFPVVQLSSLYIKLAKGWKTDTVEILSSARESEIPILYIHGTEDSVVPVEHSNNLFEVTRAKGTDHITIYGATHLQALNTNAEKYWREVEAFIRNSMD